MSFHLYQSCRACTGSAKPATRYVMEGLRIKYPYIRSLGIYSCRPVAGTGTLSIHSCGRAGDPGIPTLSGGAANRELGHPPLLDLINHADELGIMGIIYDRVRYDARSPRGRYYGGVHPHRDHIHYEQTDHHARTLTRAEVFAILEVNEGEGQVLDRNSPKPSSAVAMFQRDLIHLGYDLGAWPSIQPSLYPPGADGSFGNDAEAGTRAFQADMEIQVTGVGDALTVALAANLARFNQIRSIDAGGGGDHPDSDHAGLATKSALDAVSDKLDAHTADARTNTPHS